MFNCGIPAVEHLAAAMIATRLGAEIIQRLAVF
jgi:hypothetical protein